MEADNNGHEVPNQRTVALVTGVVLLICFIGYDVFIYGTDLRNALIKIVVLSLVPGSLLILALIVRKLNRK